MAVNSGSFCSPHVRCTPTGRTCGEPHGIKNTRHARFNSPALCHFHVRVDDEDVGVRVERGEAVVAAAGRRHADVRSHLAHLKGDDGVENK